MKKEIGFLITLFWVFTANAQKDLKIENYFRTDSTLVYSWQEDSKTWLLSSNEVYSYGTNGKLYTVIVKNLNTGSNVSKSEYLYDEKELLVTEVYYVWSGTWTPTSRNLITYDEKNNYFEIKGQTWVENNWSNSFLQKYTKYNLSGAITEFQMFEWGISDWVFVFSDHWSYDETGQLIRRLSLFSDSSVNYQILYNYNTDRLRTKMYAQYASGSSWINSWLQEYQFNDCGNQISQIQYYGVGTEWILSTKTIFFNSFNNNEYPDKKVPICHKGNTIYVSKNAVKAHLAHGDCIGECTVEKKPERHGFDEKEKHEKPPFTIYPNPAKEKITIKFDRDECKESKRVELTDFNGKTIRSFNVKDNGDLTIYRGNLISGKYCVKLVGEEVYSAVVIFE
jgi:hypothetical protein